MMLLEVRLGDRGTWQVRSGDESNRRAFLDLLGRVMRRKDDGAEPPAEKPEEPRLILP